jgi:hypothetical protein
VLCIQALVYSKSHDEIANGKVRLPQKISPEDADGLPVLQRSNLAAAVVYTAPEVSLIQGQTFFNNLETSMATSDIDSFTYFNKILAFKHEMKTIITKMDDMSAQIKKIYMEMDEISKSQPLATTMDEQKPYSEPGNPHTETPLEKIGDGG